MPCSVAMNQDEKRKQTYLFSTVENELRTIDVMDGAAFEKYVEVLLKFNGWKDTYVTKSSGDFGVDIVAYYGDEKCVFQCKRYHGHLGVKPIQEVYAGMAFYSAAHAAVITNSYFTDSAVKLAKSLGVWLYDRKALKKLIAPEKSRFKNDQETKEHKNVTDLTLGQSKALKWADHYLKNLGTSYEDLISQLEFVGFSQSDAIFAADNCGANWFEQALKAAEFYLEYIAFSYDGLVEKLEFIKFSRSQAVYAADNCGADWFEQAVIRAEYYIQNLWLSERELIGQLIIEGFTREQAEYGVEQNGY